MTKRELSSVATIIMGTSPSGDTYNSDGIGLPLLNGPTEFGITYPTCTLYTTASTRECQPSDLIFCVRGSTTGKMNWADKVYSLGRGVCAIRGETELDTKFIRYCIEDDLRSLLNMAGGGTFPNLTKDSIHSFKIPYPENRHKIADVLSAYDDLIEVNARRIRVLEAIAQSMYREWFENMEGWETKTIGDYGNVITGKTPSKTVEDYWNSRDVPFIRTPDMHGQFYCIEATDYVSIEGANSQKNAYIPPNSLCVSCIGTVGIVTIASVKSQTNQQINSIVLNDLSDLEFLYFELLGLKETLQSYAATGATMANLSKGKFMAMNVPYPPKELREKFHSVASPMFEQIKTLQYKNANLRRTRDLLLPRLVSGEVGVEGLETKGV